MFCSLLNAQQPADFASSAVVPRLVNFSGKAVDGQGKTITGIAGATFSIYADQSEGAALWLETQNVHADTKGNYIAQLGATRPEGLPLDLFTSGAARWLGVTINGGQEQPRILLLSVPYALKAADAETVGGLPASAFVLAASAVASQAGSESPVSIANSYSAPPPASSDVTTSGGTVNALPLFTSSTNVQNSIVTQTATTAVNVAGKLNHPATDAATATAGKNSQPDVYVASAFNKTTSTPVAQTFQLQAEAAGNDTTTPSGTLNLLYGSGTSAPSETGLKISNKGLITFAAGQMLPTVNGNETVTGDLTASELISTVATGTAPLKVTSTTQVANLNASLLGGKASGAFAQLAVANTFIGTQTVKGALNIGTGVAQNAAAAIVAAGSDSHNLSLYPSLQVADYNGIVQAGDEALIYSNGTVGSGGLVLAPWSDATSGLRMDGNGHVGIGTSSPTQALDLGINNNMVIRVDPGNDTTEGDGGYELVGRGTGGVPNTWWTLTAPVGGGFGVPTNSYSIWQYPPNSVPGCCLNRFNILPAEGSTDTGGAVTIDQNGNASQPLAAGGFVKAMAYVNASQTPYAIIRCFNSSLTGAAATTLPCGINFLEDKQGLGFWDFDPGFEVDNRFVSVTNANSALDQGQCVEALAISPNTVEVQTSDCNGNMKGANFYLFIY
jgi:hypothetical protein